MSYVLSDVKTTQISDEQIVINKLKYLSGKYFALLSNSANFYYSQDGITWTKETISGSDASSTVWADIVNARTLGYYFMCASAQRVNGVMRPVGFVLKSSNSEFAWEIDYLPATGEWSSMANSGSYVVMGNAVSPTIVYLTTDFEWKKEDLSELGISGGITSVVYSYTTSQFYLAVANDKSVPGLISIVHGTPGNWTYEAIQTSFDHVLTKPTLFEANGDLFWFATNAQKNKPLYADITKIAQSTAWEATIPVGVNLETETIYYIDYAYDKKGFLCNIGTKIIDSNTSIQYYPFGGYQYNNEAVDFSNQLEKKRFNKIIDGVGQNRFVFSGIDAGSSGTKTINYANIINFTSPLNRRLMNNQDIHASDIDSWKSFREKYQSGDFAGAQTIAQTLTNTQMNAHALNDLFNFIVETEQLSDPTFKSDAIQVSTTAPSNLQVGQMYFKEYN